MLIKQTVLLDEFTIWDKLETALTFHAVNLSLINQGNKSIDCRLAFEINIELYQHIASLGLLNLIKSEVLRGQTNKEFQDNCPIKIEAALKPDLLPRLLKHATTAQEAADHLLNLSQQQSESKSNLTNQGIDPLLKTESWLCLSVKQHQESGEVGFTTFWNYINPSTVNQLDITSDTIIEKLINFSKKWTDTNILENSQNTSEHLSTDFNRILESLVGVLDENLTQLESKENTEHPIANFAEAAQNVTPQLFQEIAGSWENLIDSSLADLDNKSETNDSVFTTVTNFFDKEDWSFAQINEQTAIRLVFRGKNGQWNCYAKVNEDQKIFIFYSVCPIAAPESKRTAIAEFIARANYGMIIGNFELDYDDGDIRYKTSIDVEGDSITFPLIKQLVYTNVLTMDQYLPAIIAVVENDMSPVDAIIHVES